VPLPVDSRPVWAIKAIKKSITSSERASTYMPEMAVKICAGSGIEPPTNGSGASVAPE
jgi:hypothetical protein